MTEAQNLNRFIEAQEADYPVALAEIKQGRKMSHWMWYIFPQIQGLALSETSRFYAIKDIQEASAFLHHPILGKRLIHICHELLRLESSDANAILGSPDDMKLKSSMTLFAHLPDADPVFQSLLEKFFNGDTDGRTLEMIGEA